MKNKQYAPYWSDERTKNQIQLTNKLVEKLSEANHARQKPKFAFTKNNQLFILIGGVPSILNEFSGLTFPGKTLRYYPPFFDPTQTQQQKSKKVNQGKLFKVSMESSCDQICNIIKQNGQSSAIFVYHSFGGSITAWFSSKYPQMVKGLVSLGGSPIRFYPIMKDYAKAYLTIPDISRQFIIENYEVVYSLYHEKTKNQNKWTRFKNKEELLSFTLHNDPNTLNTLFNKIRSLPLPILMIYGNNDLILTRPICTETIAYMCYFHQRSNQNNEIAQSMKARFKKLYSNQIQQKFDGNLQQKFVYLIEGGHSIHTSEKNNKYIQKLIDEYLFIILGEQAHHESIKQTFQIQTGLRPKI